MLKAQRLPHLLDLLSQRDRIDVIQIDVRRG
ncbi:hypothetical protein QBC98_007608 [Kitasatospora acidiphila]